MGRHSPAARLDWQAPPWAAFCLAVLLVWVGACGTSSRSTVNQTDEVAAGRTLFTSEGCARCHGADGDGDIGPRLNGGAVLRTFPFCEDQIQWVSLGSVGWKRERGPTYGATANPVRGGMPEFGPRLDSDQIRQVVSFTRVEFGGEDPARVGSDCSAG